MTDAGEAVLTSAAPRFADETILGLVTETYGVGGRVLRALNSERDQVVLVGDDQRQLVVKLSNEAETATNIDLEESAARWAVAADPGLPLSTPLAVRGSRAHHGVVRHPATGAAHFLRAYDRLPGQAGLVGTDLAPDTVVAYGAVTARTARALRGFFHPAAGRRLLWHVEERDRTRSSPATSTTRPPAAWWRRRSTPSRSAWPRPGPLCGPRSCTATSLSTTCSSTTAT